MPILKEQGAQDLGMYGFWKDVRRVEMIRDTYPAVKIFSFRDCLAGLFLLFYRLSFSAGCRVSASCGSEGAARCRVKADSRERKVKWKLVLRA